MRSLRQVEMVTREQDNLVFVSWRMKNLPNGLAIEWSFFKWIQSAQRRSKFNKGCALHQSCCEAFERFHNRLGSTKLKPTRSGDRSSPRKAWQTLKFLRNAARLSITSTPCALPGPWQAISSFSDHVLEASMFVDDRTGFSSGGRTANICGPSRRQIVDIARSGQAFCTLRVGTDDLSNPTGALLPDHHCTRALHFWHARLSLSKKYGCKVRHAARVLEAAITPLWDHSIKFVIQMRTKRTSVLFTCAVGSCRGDVIRLVFALFFCLIVGLSLSSSS